MRILSILFTYSSLSFLGYYFSIYCCNDGKRELQISHVFYANLCDTANRQRISASTLRMFEPTIDAIRG